MDDTTRALMENFAQAYGAYAIKCAKEFPASIDLLMLLNDTGRILFSHAPKAINYKLTNDHSDRSVGASTIQSNSSQAM